MTKNPPVKVNVGFRNTIFIVFITSFWRQYAQFYFK